MAEQNQNQDMQKPHKRRVRYKGTHPRTFEEKYKEREPEKYAETIEKVISKGSTPAGMHLSICVDEILEFLQIQPGQRGLDATWVMAATAGGCWKSWRAPAIFMVWTWTPLRS